MRPNPTLCSINWHNPVTPFPGNWVKYPMPPSVSNPCGCNSLHQVPRKRPSCLTIILLWRQLTYVCISETPHSSDPIASMFTAYAPSWHPLLRNREKDLLHVLDMYGVRTAMWVNSSNQSHETSWYTHSNNCLLTIQGYGWMVVYGVLYHSLGWWASFHMIRTQSCTTCVLIVQVPAFMPVPLPSR